MQTVQLKVTLPVQLQDFLRSRAQKYGLTMSSYVKNLIVDDIKAMDAPIYQASNKTEEAYQQAKEDEKNGKLIQVGDLDAFFS
jgi:hypothetical protein